MGSNLKEFSAVRFPNRGVTESVSGTPELPVARLLLIAIGGPNRKAVPQTNWSSFFAAIKLQTITHNKNPMSRFFMVQLLKKLKNQTVHEILYRGIQVLKLVGKDERLTTSHFRIHPPLVVLVH